jgi:hypothetical protein
VPSRRKRVLRALIVVVFACVAGAVFVAYEVHRRHRPRHVRAAVYTADGSHLVTVSSDETASFVDTWDLTSALDVRFGPVLRARTVLEAQRTPVRPVPVRASEVLVADGSRVLVRDVRLHETREVVRLRGRITELAATPDGRRIGAIVSHGLHWSLVIVDAERGGVLLDQRFAEGNRNETPSSVLALTPDGERAAVLTSARNGAIGTFDVRTGESAWHPLERTEEENSTREMASVPLACAMRADARTLLVAFRGPSCGALGLDGAFRMRPTYHGSRNERVGLIAFGGDAIALDGCVWSPAMGLSPPRCVSMAGLAAKVCALSPDGREVAYVDDAGRLVRADANEE